MVLKSRQQMVSISSGVFGLIWCIPRAGDSGLIATKWLKQHSVIAADCGTIWSHKMCVLTGISSERTQSHLIDLICLTAVIHTIDAWDTKFDASGGSGKSSQALSESTAQTSLPSSSRRWLAAGAAETW